MIRVFPGSHKKEYRMLGSKALFEETKDFRGGLGLFEAGCDIRDSEVYGLRVQGLGLRLQRPGMEIN